MILYTVAELDGSSMDLTAGEDFVTSKQRIDTDHEATDASLPIGSYIACQVQHVYADLAGYDDALLGRWGITRSTVADPPAPVPASISILRAQLTLDSAGLLDDVETYMANPSTPKAHKIFWAKTDLIWRDSEVTTAIATLLGLTSGQLDDLFRAAAALTL